MSEESESQTADHGPDSTANGRRSFRHGLVLLLWLHLLLVMHFAPPHVMFSGEPAYAIDFSLHYYQADRAMQAFEGSGKLWGYDPLVLAGHPVGTLEDLSSKTLELFVIALTALGIGKALAFNLYVLMVHLLVPFVAWAVGRLFRLGDRQTLFLVASWVLLWFFDSLFHWTWHCGMVSWAMTSYLAVLFVALFYQAVDGLGEGESARRMARFWMPAALLAALLALMHPFSVLPAGLPALWIYLRARTKVGLAGHLFFASTLLLAAGAASIWLLPALDWAHYLLPVDTFLRPNPLYLLSDFLDLTFDHEQTGMPVRSMLRLLVLSLGAYGFSTMHRAQDRRCGPLLFACATLFALAYLGGLLPVLNESQPYRQLVPAVLFATIPAALAFPGLASRHVWSRVARPVQVVALVVLILLTPRFVRTVLFYFPELLPRHAHGQASFGDVAMPLPHPLKHVAPPPEAIALRLFLEDALRSRPGRVVVEDYPLAEYLAATSDLPILGGIEQRPIPHADAHLFRLRDDGSLPPDQLAAYLKRFAVRFVVLRDVCKELEHNREEQLDFVRTLGPLRIYEAVEEPSYFLRGEGRIVHQGLNSIMVDRARADRAEGDLVLRFHWAETLACRPDCRVERETVSGARVGFIRIEDPPSSFEIYNSYRQLHTRWRGDRQPLPVLESADDDRSE